jgi:tetratricopeptide (TPR) repeat protein
MHAISLAQENWTRALSDYQEKVRRSEPFPDPEVLATLAELMVTTGQLESAMAVCERAVNQNELAGARKSLAVALRAQGRLYTAQQHFSMAEECLHRALEMTERLDLPWESGHTLYHLGLLYKQRAEQAANDQHRKYDLSLARNYLERALGFYESLHAEPAITRTLTALYRDSIPIA